MGDVFTDCSELALCTGDIIRMKRTAVLMNDASWFQIYSSDHLEVFQVNLPPPTLTTSTLTD